jgi:2-oxoglutarate ferredoxin oxidoreductase subunit alpha
MSEAFEILKAAGIAADGLRIRAFPFASDVDAFIAGHEHIFLVEQNRDAQLRSLIVNECGIDPARITPVLHYDGTPITARFIAHDITRRLLGDSGAQPRVAVAT